MSAEIPGRRRVLVDLACGDFKRDGAIGTDRRRTAVTDIVCDSKALPFRDGSIDDLWAVFLLEHLSDPHTVLSEVWRVLAAEGTASFRVPNLGTYSAHLDVTHVFLADLALWKTILGGYFQRITVRPIDTKYRDSRLLVLICRVLIKVLHFNELAQVWDLTVSGKRSMPERAYDTWWTRAQQLGQDVPTDRQLPS